MTTPPPPARPVLAYTSPKARPVRPPVRALVGLFMTCVILGTAVTIAVHVTLTRGFELSTAIVAAPFAWAWAFIAVDAGLRARAARLASAAAWRTSPAAAVLLGLAYPATTLLLRLCLQLDRPHAATAAMLLSLTAGAFLLLPWYAARAILRDTSQNN